LDVEYKEWQEDAIKLNETGVVSWREISNLLKVPKSTVSDFLRAYAAVRNFPEGYEAKDYSVIESVKEYDNSRILFISDMHIPFHHPKMLRFIEGLKVRYEPTRVICVGDEIDHHAMSFHDSDPDLPSAGDELKRALPVIAEVHRLFPEMDLVDSNHGSLAYRKAKHHGIPRHYIKSYKDVLEVGDGWTWHMDLVLDMQKWDVPDVYVHHGKSSNGLKLSQAMGMSCVQGHYHEAFNIQFWANPVDLYFSMQIGCLIDDASYAFSYNNVNLKRPLIGTGLIIEGIPVLETMPL
jgi:hypothetical protein